MALVLLQAVVPCHDASVCLISPPKILLLIKSISSPNWSSTDTFHISPMRIFWLGSWHIYDPLNTTISHFNALSDDSIIHRIGVQLFLTMSNNVTLLYNCIDTHEILVIPFTLSLANSPRKILLFPSDFFTLLQAWFIPSWRILVIYCDCLTRPTLALCNRRNSEYLLDIHSIKQYQ